MNGAVFQTSAKIITIRACGSSPEPDRLGARAAEFTKPRFGSKIVFHMIAVTTVSTAHGTRTTVRSRPWPLNAECMAIAMARPSSVSRTTEAIVKMNVTRVADQNSVLCNASM